MLVHTSPDASDIRDVSDDEVAEGEVKRLSLLSSLSGSLMFGEEAVNGAAAADKVDNVIVEEVAGTTVFAVIPADFGG